MGVIRMQDHVPDLFAPQGQVASHQRFRNVFIPIAHLLDDNPLVAKVVRET
jgi:hypothetical protein